MATRFASGLALVFSFVVGCAPATPFGRADEPNPNGPNESQRLTGSQVELNDAFIVRTLKAGVLETVETLSRGSVVLLPEDDATVNFPFRNAQGDEEFSSTGFLKVLRIESVPSADQARLPRQKLDQLTALPGELYISAVAGQNSGHEETFFPPLRPKDPSADYLAGFNENGQPKFNYTKGLTKRFGERLNRPVPDSRIPASARVKWERIMAELVRAGNRMDFTPKHLLKIDTEEGKRRSVDFEKTGKVSLDGAWTVAVEGTATRHGFANVPCAEFMSEVLRQAYARAGYAHTEDFNDRKKNRLDYKNGAAAVKNLSAYMDLAGWVPWEASKYIPPAGAIMMHETGLTPGHAYMSGGDGARFIIDNGMPQGRDLRGTSKKILEIMYRHGVFFLPPGINPQPW